LLELSRSWRPVAATPPATGLAADTKDAPEVKYSKKFEKDWHKEWKHGDFPSWKKVIKVDGIEKWEDRQSDGKPGFLQEDSETEGNTEEPDMDADGEEADEAAESSDDGESEDSNGQDDDEYMQKWAMEHGMTKMTMSGAWL